MAQDPPPPEDVGCKEPSHKSQSGTQDGKTRSASLKDRGGQVPRPRKKLLGGEQFSQCLKGWHRGTRSLLQKVEEKEIPRQYLKSVKVLKRREGGKTRTGMKTACIRKEKYRARIKIEESKWGGEKSQKLFSEGGRPSEKVKKRRRTRGRGRPMRE